MHALIYYLHGSKWREHATFFGETIVLEHISHLYIKTYVPKQTNLALVHDGLRMVLW
jgi:hypothetical protein